MPDTTIKILTHYQKGIDTQVSCVFSCPGRHEKIANYPAAMATGTNLKNLFELLNQHLQTSIFIRELVTITNSWAKVEYKKLTNRTEANDNEILEEGNLKRLCLEVEDTEKYIICFGAKALLVINALKQDGRLFAGVIIIKTDHLSLSRLNRAVHNDIHGNPILSAKNQKDNGIQKSQKGIQKENTNKRLEVVALEIVEQINCATM
jgi:hypothetical protein